MSGFDRLPGLPHRPAPGAGVPDPQGKRALFSTEPAIPAAGSVVVDCPLCQEKTVLSLRQAVRASFPSLHLPVLRKGAASWMRCPACGRRGWLHASLRL